MLVPVREVRKVMREELGGKWPDLRNVLMADNFEGVIVVPDDEWDEDSMNDTDANDASMEELEAAEQILDALNDDAAADDFVRGVCAEKIMKGEN